MCIFFSSSGNTNLISYVVFMALACSQGKQDKCEFRTENEPVDLGVEAHF